MLFHEGEFFGTALANAWLEAIGAQWIDDEVWRIISRRRAELAAV
jgi:hypothetical protein